MDTSRAHVDFGVFKETFGPFDRLTVTERAPAYIRALGQYVTVHQW